MNLDPTRLSSPRLGADGRYAPVPGQSGQRHDPVIVVPSYFRGGGSCAALFAANDPQSPCSRYFSRAGSPFSSLSSSATRSWWARYTARAVDGRQGPCMVKMKGTKTTTQP